MEHTNNYVKVASYEGKKGDVKKVVLLYSGGLDTSTMIKWIQDSYKAEVIALTIDIGQRVDDLVSIQKKALKLGAVKSIVIDAKDEFATDYIAKSIKANGSYEGKYYLATSLGRPLLAKWAVKIAAQEGADAIAHGATGKGGDQIRLEGSALAINPDIKIIAPVREWGMGRTEQIEYCKKHGIPISQTTAKPYSYDENMWGSSAEGGEIENPALIPPLDKILQIVTLPEKAPDQPEFLKLDFFKGIPIALNGQPYKLADLIIKVGNIAARHGVGITVMTEDRVIGVKIRNIYESPAAEVIITAHKALESFTATGRENEFKTIIDQKWGHLCYGALWFEPLMDNLNGYIDTASDKVTGKLTVKLYKGVVEVLAIETSNSVFDEKLASFMDTKNDNFNQNASAGFIEHYTMQMRLARRRQHTALLSIGGRDTKLKFLSSARRLVELNYQLYATYKTHKFLRANGIEAILVNKISSPELKPNLSDMLGMNRFDLIVCIPTHTERMETVAREKTDGQIIRQHAASSGVALITELRVAQDFISELTKMRA